jgi:hypothetical protein
MSFKTFTCAICGAEVTKPKSYALADGKRACRIHQEAQDAHTQAVSSLEQKREAAKHKVASSWRNHRHAYPIGCHCLHCKVCGVDTASLAMLRLEVMGAAKALGQDTFSFDPEAFVNKLYAKAVVESYGKEPVAITRFTANTLKPWQLKQLVANPMMREIVELVGVVALCNDCAKDFGFERPQPTITSLSLLANVAESFIDSRAEFYKSSL